ncbi:unnamed protein product [Spodoptera exigua]|nr:unnamed protein product [Spodoptera exigua]
MGTTGVNVLEWRARQIKEDGRQCGTDSTFLPYVKGVTDTIGHLLRRRYSIRTIFRPPGQLRHVLRSPKDKDPLAVPGVYMIPCDCGSSYIGETRRNITTRLKEHIRSVKNRDTHTSVVARARLTSSVSTRSQY